MHLYSSFLVIQDTKNALYFKSAFTHSHITMKVPCSLGAIVVHTIPTRIILCNQGFSILPKNNLTCRLHALGIKTNDPLPPSRPHFFRLNSFQNYKDQHSSKSKYFVSVARKNYFLEAWSRPRIQVGERERERGGGRYK